MPHRRYTRANDLTKAERALEPNENEFWTRSRTLALALQDCTHCHGLGLRPGRAGQTSPCNCVFRAIFRICYGRFRLCADKAKHISRVSMENLGASPGNKKATWGMKNEEFVADFCLVSRRALSDTQHRLFTYHFLLGADWQICCPKLNIDRGTFFHEVYRIEQKLGRTFAELLPYALFPVDQYFSSTPGRKPRDPFPAPAEASDSLPRSKPLLKFPVKRPALKAMAA